MFTIQRSPKGPGRFQCPPDSVSSSASPLPLIQRYSAPRAPSPSPSVRSLLFSLSLPQLSWSQLQQYKVASARREELLNRCWNRQSDDQPSSCAEGLASESRRRGGLRDQLVPLLCRPSVSPLLGLHSTAASTGTLQSAVSRVQRTSCEESKSQSVK